MIERKFDVRVDPTFICFLYSHRESLFFWGGGPTREELMALNKPNYFHYSRHILNCDHHSSL